MIVLVASSAHRQEFIQLGFGPNLGQNYSWTLSIENEFCIQDDNTLTDLIQELLLKGPEVGILYSSLALDNI